MSKAETKYEELMRDPVFRELFIKEIEADYKTQISKLESVVADLVRERYILWKALTDGLPVETINEIAARVVASRDNASAPSNKPQPML